MTSNNAASPSQSFLSWRLNCSFFQENRSPFLQRLDENNDSHRSDEISGSSLLGATFNFTNAIIGAGAMSLGGAFANSGGFVSIACCLVSAALAKLSSDQVVSLRSTFPKECISYETIGEKCYGFVGKALVLMNKSLFAFGCLVAYVIVIKDNFGQGLEGILYHNNNTCNSTFRTLLRNDTMVATIICTVVILPICLIMRRRQSISSYLSILSLISILSTLFLVAIVIYLYFVNNNVPTNNEKNDDTLFVKRWLQIRIGLFPR